MAEMNVQVNLLYHALGCQCMFRRTVFDGARCFRCLLEIAVNMVKKGVTPDVITFVDASNTDINEVVSQEIISEHNTDQNYINMLCEQFMAAVQLLEDQMNEIASHADNNKSSQQAHHECRAREATACAYSKRCEA